MIYPAIFGAAKTLPIIVSKARAAPLTRGAGARLRPAWGRRHGSRAAPAHVLACQRRPEYSPSARESRQAVEDAAAASPPRPSHLHINPRRCTSQVVFDLFLNGPLVYFPLYFVIKGFFAGKGPADALREYITPNGRNLVLRYWATWTPVEVRPSPAACVLPARRSRHPPPLTPSRSLGAGVHVDLRAAQPARPIFVDGLAHLDRRALDALIQEED